MCAARSYRFGQHSIPATQIFFRSRYSLGLVNISPVRPGHLLVITRRPVERFSGMHPKEVSDLFSSAQIISRVVEKHWKTDSLTLALQDGPAAGQTVKHVHVHIIPRHFADFERNDQDIEKPRPRRSEEDMAAEALELSKYFTPEDPADGELEKLEDL